MHDETGYLSWDSLLDHQILEYTAESLFERKSVNHQHHSEKYWAGMLRKLEGFVFEAVKGNEIPFVPTLTTRMTTAAHGSRLVTQHFSRMPEFLTVVRMLSPQFEYSELVEVFMQTCKDLGLLEDEPIYWGNVLGGMNPMHPIAALEGRTTGAVFNDLVRRMRIAWRAGARERYRTRRSDVKERIVKYHQYERALFEDCSRLVIIRLDVGYVQGMGTTMELQTALDDVDHLINNMRHNALFKNKKGYIAKLEYGIEKGLHWHLILFFDGSLRNGRSHAFLTEQIGKYWSERITKGRGTYWNCNAREKSFNQRGILGIGVIHADETHLRENLRNNVITYLCKEDQYFRPKGGGDVNLIRRGAFPKMPKKKPGRPRTRHLKVCAAK